MIFAQIHGRKIEDFQENKDVYYSCALTELIHNGTLMVDDVMDKSLKRRGDDCTHIKFGVDVAVNTGNYLYFAPLEQIKNYIPAMRKRDKIYDIYT